MNYEHKKLNYEHELKKHDNEHNLTMNMNLIKR